MAAHSRSSSNTPFVDPTPEDDIDQAILAEQWAVELSPDDHPDKSSFLNSLANSHFSRFERFGKLAKIDQAILRKKAATLLIPKGRANEPDYFYSLGNMYHA